MLNARGAQAGLRLRRRRHGDVTREPRLASLSGIGVTSLCLDLGVEKREGAYLHHFYGLGLSLRFQGLSSTV